MHLDITAGEVEPGDVFPDGDTVVDKEFFYYPKRSVVEFSVIDEFGEDQAKEFTITDKVTVKRDTDAYTNLCQGHDDAFGNTDFCPDECEVF